MEPIIELSDYYFIQELFNGEFSKFDERDKSLIKNMVSKYHFYYSIVGPENSLIRLSNSPMIRVRVTHNDIEENPIKEIMYISLGKKSIKRVLISKLIDEWYLVEVMYYDKDKEVRKYYKCDQLEPVIDLIFSITKKMRVVDHEGNKIKKEKDKKINQIVGKMKRMSLSDFENFCKDFYKNY